MTEQTTIRIVDTVNGYCLSDDALPYIDERGASYPTIREAVSSARAIHDGHGKGYTHYRAISGRVRKL